MNPTPGTVPSGVLALMGEQFERQRRAEQRCLNLLIAKGFQPVHLPVLEYSEGESASGYRFVDRAGRLIAVRTDFTPLAGRIFAPRLAAGELPLSICYAGEVVRPQGARLRQLPELYQLGFERYGIAGGAAEALEITLALVTLAGVSLESCHVTVGIAGLGEEILAQLLEEPADEELLELLRVKDVESLADTTGARGAPLDALAAAVLGEAPELWAEPLGVASEVGRLKPLLELAGAAGIPATVEVAPRLAGPYYRGAVFALWGRQTHAVLAGGGEYDLEVRGNTVAAAGGSVALGIALEEAGDRGHGTGDRGASQ